MKIDWSAYAPPEPTFLGTKTFVQYPLSELVERIDWTPFFRTWELAGVYPKIMDDPVVGEHARNLFKDAEAMLRRIVDEKWLRRAASSVSGRRTAMVRKASYCMIQSA